MRKPNEPVAEPRLVQKLRRWGPIALQDLFNCLSKSGSYSAKRFGVIGGIMVTPSGAMASTRSRFLLILP